MAAPRKLKVFQAQIGFYDTVVAAPSRPAALRAWGLRQDLFASGHAKVAEDPVVIEAARAHPEIPLKRAVGSTDAFAVEAAHLPDIPEAPSKSRKRPKPQPPTKTTPAQKPPPKPAADRRDLDAAEARLLALENARQDQEAEFADRMARLEQAIAHARSEHAAAHKALTTEVARARAAYRKAGGKD
jgi:hypothetical protein